MWLHHRIQKKVKRTNEDDNDNDDNDHNQILSHNDKWTYRQIGLKQIIDFAGL